MFCDLIYMFVLKRCKGGWFICIILEILFDKYVDSVWILMFIKGLRKVNLVVLVIS